MGYWSADLKIGKLSWIIHMGPTWSQGSLKVEKEGRERQRKRCEELQAKKAEWPLETRKGKGTNFPLEPAEKNVALWHLAYF